MTEYLVKLVPWKSPNDDGEWRKIKVPRTLTLGTTFTKGAQALSNYIPAGFFIVDYMLSDGW